MTPTRVISAHVRALVLADATLYYVGPGPEPVAVTAGEIIDLWLSDGPLTTRPTDDPPSRTHVPILAGGLSYELDILEGQDPPRLAGTASLSRGAALSLINANNRLADWIRVLSFDGQPIVVREVESTFSASALTRVPQLLDSALVLYEGTGSGRLVIDQESVATIQLDEGAEVSNPDRPRMLGLGGYVSFDGVAGWGVAPYSLPDLTQIAVVFLLRIGAFPGTLSEVLNIRGVDIPVRVYLQPGQICADLTTTEGSSTLVAAAAVDTWYWVAVTYDGAVGSLLLAEGLGGLLDFVDDDTAMSGDLVSDVTSLVVSSSRASSLADPSEVDVSEIRIYSAWKSRLYLRTTTGRPLDPEDSDDAEDLAFYARCDERLLSSLYDEVDGKLVALTAAGWGSLLEGERDQAGLYWPEVLGESRSHPLVAIDQVFGFYAVRRGPVEEWRYLFASNVGLAREGGWTATDFVFDAGAGTITTATGSLLGVVPNQQLLITGAPAGANNGDTVTVSQILGLRAIRVVETLTTVVASGSVTLSTVTPQWRAHDDYVELLVDVAGELTAHVRGAVVDGSYLEGWLEQAEYLAELAGYTAVDIEAGGRAAWKCSVYISPDASLPEIIDRHFRSAGAWCVAIGSTLTGQVVEIPESAMGTIRLDQVEAQGVVSADSVAPVPYLRVPVGNRPAWQTADQGDSVEAAWRDQVSFAAEPWRIYRPTEAASGFPAAAEPPYLETHLSRQVNARTLSLLTQRISECLPWLAHVAPSIRARGGEVWNLVYDRHGFDNGRACLVVGVQRGPGSTEDPPSLVLRLLELGPALPELYVVGDYVDDGYVE